MASSSNGSERSNDSSSASDNFRHIRPAQKRRRIPEDRDLLEPTVHIKAKNGDFSNGFITLTTEAHEISRTEYHLPSLTTFVDRLKQACDPLWSSRLDPYAKVFALLIYWVDDDLGVIREIEKLSSMLSDTYGFLAETWGIPSGKGAYFELVQKVHSVLTPNDAEGSLFLLYYGGHAYQDAQSQPVWVSRREQPAEVELGGILPLLGRLDADILLLFDSCQAVPLQFDSKGKGIAAAITATGFEPRPMATAAEVGPDSFTNALIEELGQLSLPSPPGGRPLPFSDVTLHSRLLSRLRVYPSSLSKSPDGSFKKDEHGNHVIEPFRRRTPIYHFLSRNKPPRPIALAPLSAGLLPSAQPPASSVPQKPLPPSLLPSALPPPLSPEPLQTRDVLAPHVLVSARIASKTLSEAELNAWKTWILGLPASVTNVDIRAEDIRIEGAYPSLSTLLLVRMPLSLWCRLRKDPAMSFIGYITGDDFSERLEPAKLRLKAPSDNTSVLGARMQGRRYSRLFASLNPSLSGPSSTRKLSKIEGNSP